LTPGQTLTLRRERQLGDPWRIGVWLEIPSGDLEIGRLPENCSEPIASQMDRGTGFAASVDRIDIHGPLRQFVSVYVNLCPMSESALDREPDRESELRKARL
jgi:hypothetical protein